MIKLDIFLGDLADVSAKTASLLQVSYIQPNAAVITSYPAVENIGVSNHDHAANCLAFHDDGRLLICSGSNTNAGVPANKFGSLDVRFRQNVFSTPKLECVSGFLIP